MAIEKQLEVLEQILKIKGAKVDVHFHELESEEEAAAIMTEFTADFTHFSSDNTHWFSACVEGIDLTTFYKFSKEDQIRELEQKLASLKGESA